MRSILSISLPEGKREEITRRAKMAGKSISAYIIQMFEREKNLISEDELIQMVKDVEEEYRMGKTKKLRSLKDLMK